MAKDWSRGECINQAVICLLLGLLPVSANLSGLPPVLHPLHQVVEWPGNPGKSKYEPPVEVAKSQEDLDVPICLRGVVLPGPDGFYSTRVHLDAILIDNEPQEFEFVLEEAALSHIGIQLGLPESFQHEFQVSLVFLRGPRKDEDVV